MKIVRHFATIAKKGATYACFVLLLDAVALGLDSMLLSRNMFHFFTLMTLLESALLFLVGGAMDVGGSVSFHKLIHHPSKTESEWSAERHKNMQSRAAPFVSAGIILLVLSFALAYPLN